MMATGIMWWVIVVIMIVASACDKTINEPETDANNNGGYPKLLEIRHYPGGDSLKYRRANGEIIWINAPDKK